MNRTETYEPLIAELHRLEDEGRTTEAVERAQGFAAQARARGAEGFALFFEGEALCLEGALRDGARLQRQAVELLPENVTLRTSLAVVLSLLGHVRDALRHLDRALAVDDQNLEALGQRGVCLAKLGFYLEALACFEGILALSHDNLYAQRNKAVILSRLGQEQDALEILNRVLESDPKDTHARTERRILLDEMRLRGTPLGWLLLWVRKTLVPVVLRLRHRRALDTAPSPGAGLRGCEKSCSG